MYVLTLICFESKSEMTYFIYKDSAGEYRWRLRNSTEIIATSHDGHTYRFQCVDEIEIVKQSQDADIVDVD